MLRCSSMVTRVVSPCRAQGHSLATGDTVQRARTNDRAVPICDVVN